MENSESAHMVSGPLPGGNGDSVGHVETIGADANMIMELNAISTLLAGLTSRLGAIEVMPPKSTQRAYKSLIDIAIELLRILFGGWAPLAFLLVILFQTPIRAILNTLPAKLQAASEIQVGSVSLKTTIQNEALRVGAVDLSKTIPNLSSSAIDLLLQAPRRPDQKNLISYTPNSSGDYEDVAFPSDSLTENLSELQTAGLAQIRVEVPGALHEADINGNGLKKLGDDFRQKYPGKPSSESWSGSDQSWWAPTVPAPKGSLPLATWSLTDKGAQAVDIILKSVSAELAPMARDNVSAK